MDSSQLAATMLDRSAHGLRNQLNVINTALMLLADEGDGAAEIADDAAQSARQLTSAVERMIIAARADVGVDTHEPCELGALVHGGAHRARREADRSLEVTADVDEVAAACCADVPPILAERVIADMVIGHLDTLTELPRAIRITAAVSPIAADHARIIISERPTTPRRFAEDARVTDSAALASAELCARSLSGWTLTVSDQETRIELPLTAQV